MTTLEEVQKIFKYLETPYDNEPAILQDRIMILNTYLARSGQLLAEAERDLNESKNAHIESVIIEYPNLPASVFNELVKSKLRDKQFVLTLSKRLNSAITHSLDSLRSQLSFMKSEIFSN